MSRRIVVNIAFFALIGVALAVWAVTNVVSFDFIDRPFTVTAQFDTSPGLSPRFEVTYLGQRIGAIRKVVLDDKVVTATLKIDRDEEVPRAVTAAVRRKSAVGEPYVDLQPMANTDPDVGPRLSDGDRIPIDRTSTPLAYSELFRAVDQLVDAIEPNDLRTLVHELAVGLDGRADSLRQLFAGADQITGDLAANAELLDRTIADLTELTHTLATHRGSLAASFDNVAALAETLRRSESDVVALLEKAPTLGSSLARITAQSKHDLGCTLDALGIVGTKLDRATTSALAHVIAKSPRFLFVLTGLLTDYGLKGRLAVNVGPTGPLVYPKPLAPPVVPRLKECAAAAATATGAVAPGVAPTAGVAEGVAPTPTGRVPSYSGRVPAVEPSAPATPRSTPTSVGGDLELARFSRLLIALGIVAVLALVAAVRRRLTRRSVAAAASDDGGDGD